MRTVVATMMIVAACGDRDTSQQSLDEHRVNTPAESIRARLTVIDTTVSNVPVVWINPQQRANGVIVYLHGGAYQAGPYAGEWKWLAGIATQSETAAVMVIYRLAPEHPFPAAFDDAVSLVSALQGDRWILAGASAGAGLAIGVTRAAIDRGMKPPAGLLLQAPWVDMSLSHSELARYDEADPIVDVAALRGAAERFAKGHDLTDPRLSPIHTNFADFPPTRLEIGTRDMMLPDNRLLRDRLLAAGVELDYVEEPNALHVFAHRDAPESKRAIAEEVRWIRKRLSH